MPFVLRPVSFIRWPISPSACANPLTHSILVYLATEHPQVNIVRSQSCRIAEVGTSGVV
jgi:hypothetical protein